MIHIVYFLGTFITGTWAFSTNGKSISETTQIHNKDLCIGSPITKTDQISSLKQKEKLLKQGEIEYLDEKIKGVSSQIDELQACCPNSQQPINNPYIRDYRAMVSELEDLKKAVAKTSPGMTHTQIKHQVDDIYQKYFPQDDD